MEKLLTVNQVAHRLQVSTSAIYKWIDEKRIPYIDFGAIGKRRCIRFREKDLEKDIENKTQN